MSRYFHIATMGCQMNEYDSDRVSQLLLDYGFLPTGHRDSADLIMINTCTVREKAQQKAFSLLGRLAPLKKKRPDMILGVMGCIAQQEGHDLIKRFPEIDLVLGTREICRIQEFLERIETKQEKVVAAEITEKPTYLIGQNGYFKGRVKGFISIMEGCNNFCSYCIVPYVRGREVSRSPQDILNEAENLVQQGVKEITLLGQNVNSYSSKDEREVRFPELLRMLSSLDGLARIRFTTSHPKDLSDELIGCFGSIKTLCPHIHLPFQAGSNRILKLMNRGYTRELYMEKIKSLRDMRHDIAVTSDVMVGFPQETDDDFRMTLDLISKIEFDNLYSFKYSDRRGTAAQKMEEKIDESEKSSRLAELQEMQKGITLKKNRMLEGRELEILVEGDSRRGGQVTGRTITNKVVNFSCDNIILGDIVKVIIECAFVNSLMGVTVVSEH
ncbi:MAG: tRNA (N6-isopentenyl adenosine(37)-C2)-methylthiotransferase MiaB [Deltaproteobacteria bacterium]|nr:tRNA (N6-isopentenyl adenosine(37)-C2)-methylthiotransferase MiaB [Deltaproteobacteria bacterium]